jgi:hypothetical protein
MVSTMTNFQHYDLGQQPEGAIVEVEVDSRVNVRLMDDPNFRAYQSSTGGRYRYEGGQALRSPLRLVVPRPGHWHVALDLGGGAGRWRSSVTVHT